MDTNKVEELSAMALIRWPTESGIGRLLRQQSKARQAAYLVLSGAVESGKLPPTCREIADKLGVAHTGVQRGLHAMVAAGLLKMAVSPDEERERTPARAFVPVDEDDIPQEGDQ